MSNTEIAKKVIDAIGGVENVKMLSKILKKFKEFSLTQVNTKLFLVLEL